jgi:hypothetical protein
MPPTHELAFFTDVQQFRSAALPILESDTVSNTLALSALHSIAEIKPGVVLGLLTSSSSSKHVLVSPGLQGIGCQLYLAPALTEDDSAKLIAQQLPNMLCTTVSTTSAGAGLLQQHCGWQAKHRMNVMLYKPITSTVGCTASMPAAASMPGTATAAEAGAGHTCSATTAAAAAGLSAPSSSHRSSIGSSLQLRSCSADNPTDVQLVLHWVGEFLAQVFHLASAPPAPQLQAMVLPRLQQGLYFVLCDSSAATGAAAAAPVCMASHVPTSSDSTRITMLYTPAEHRSRGYGGQTSECAVNLATLVAWVGLA